MKNDKVLAYGHQMTNGRSDCRRGGSKRRLQAMCCDWSLAPNTAAARWKTKHIFHDSVRVAFLRVTDPRSGCYPQPSIPIVSHQIPAFLVQKKLRMVQKQQIAVINSQKQLPAKK